MASNLQASATSSFTGISRDDVMRFLTERLKIANAAELQSGSQKVFIDSIIREWLKVLSFNTVKQLAVPSLRRAPTEQEAIDDVMSGIAGLCGTHSTAMYHVLKSLGFNCQMATGLIGGPMENHVYVLVYDLETTGDVFLVDVATGYPTFSAIQLKNSDGYISKIGPVVESFCNYKFVKRGDTYLRCNLTRASKDQNDRPYMVIDEQNYGIFCTHHLQPRLYEHISAKLTESVYAQKDHKFNTVLMMCKYPDGKFLGLRGRTVRREDTPGVLTVCELDTDDDVKAFIQQHFPEFAADLVDRALAYRK